MFKAQMIRLQTKKALIISIRDYIVFNAKYEVKARQWNFQA